jgi:glycerol-3-phosphate dehydrogenase
LLEAEVKGIERENNSVKCVITTQGIIRTKFVVNAAGLYADDISRMVGIDDFYIYPRKGEYFIFDKKIGSLVNRPVFPIPTSVSKGILVTKTIEGNTMIGPNAQDLDIKYKYAKDRDATTNEGLKEVLEAASRLIPDLPKASTINNFAGLRAASNTGDFIIRSYKNVTGFINVAGIKSPGLTAAPAIAELVIGILKDEGLELKQKKEFDPIREKPIRFADLSPEEKNALIAKDSTYGLIVCRCEHVTEGEIVTATKRGARTMDGIKYRTRCGMGRCQGGFCGPRVAAILARELSIPLEQVTKQGDGSNLVVGKTKSVVKQKLNV